MPGGTISKGGAICQFIRYTITGSRIVSNYTTAVILFSTLYKIADVSS